jgi:hypothetical protein
MKAEPGKDKASHMIYKTASGDLQDILSQEF